MAPFGRIPIGKLYPAMISYTVGRLSVMVRDDEVTSGDRMRKRVKMAVKDIGVALLGVKRIRFLFLFTGLR